MPPRPSTLGYLNVEEVLKVVGSAGGPQVQAAPLDGLRLGKPRPRTVEEIEGVRRG